MTIGETKENSGIEVRDSRTARLDTRLANYYREVSDLRRLLQKEEQSQKLWRNRNERLEDLERRLIPGILNRMPDE